MKRMKHLGYIVVVLLMVVALVLACAPKPEVAPPPEAPPPEAPPPEAPPAEELPPIKIGLLAELTGFVSTYGPLEKRGAEYALDEIGYEVAGRKIELIIEDNASDPAVAVDKARKLVEHDEVDLVLGPLLSNAGDAVAAYLQKSGTPNFAMMNHSSELGKKIFDGTYPFMFLIDGVLPSMGYPMGLYAYDVLGYRTATLVAQDYVTGYEFCGGFQLGFEERGGKVIQIQRIPFGTMDYAPYLTTLKEVDTIAYFLPANCIGFQKQYSDYGLEIPLMMVNHDSLSFDELQELGDITLGVIGSGTWSSLIDTPRNKAFVESFRKKFDRIPALQAESAYTNLQLFLEAVRYTKGDTSHEAIIDALHKVEVNSPRGTVSFGPQNMGQTTIYMFEIVKADWGYDWQAIAEYPMKNIWEYPTEPTE